MGSIKYKKEYAKWLKLPDPKRKWKSILCSLAKGKDYDAIISGDFKTKEGTLRQKYINYKGDKIGRGGFINRVYTKKMPFDEAIKPDKIRYRVAKMYKCKECHGEFILCKMSKPLIEVCLGCKRNTVVVKKEEEEIGEELQEEYKILKERLDKEYLESYIGQNNTRALKENGVDPMKNINWRIANYHLCNGVDGELLSKIYGIAINKLTDTHLKMRFEAS